MLKEIEAINENITKLLSEITNRTSCKTITGFGINRGVFENDIWIYVETNENERIEIKIDANDKIQIMPNLTDSINPKKLTRIITVEEILK